MKNMIDIIEEGIKNKRYVFAVIDTLVHTNMFIRDKETGKIESARNMYVTKITEEEIIGIMLNNSLGYFEADFDRSSWFIGRIEEDNVLTENELNILKIR
jgi:hypothetical protein